MNDEAPAQQPAGSRYVFVREEELGEILGLLHERRVTILALAGRPATGKSQLLKQVAVHAQAEGWHVVPSYDQPCLVIDESTSPGSLARRLSRGLKLGGPLAASNVSSALDQLSAAAPAVILVDDFRPNSRFRAWFQDEFVPQLRKVFGPVVMIVAEGPPADSSSTIDYADRVISLDTLKMERAEQAIREAAAGVTPPLHDRELHEFARATSCRPEWLASLVEVFRAYGEQRA